MYNLDYTMTIDQITEETNFPDPFWIEYGEKIRAVREAIEIPRGLLSVRKQENWE